MNPLDLILAIPTSLLLLGLAVVVAVLLYAVARSTENAVLEAAEESAPSFAEWREGFDWE